MALGGLEEFGHQSFQRFVFALYAKLPCLLDLYQGVALDVEATRRETYHKIYDSATPDMSGFDVELFSYSGDDEPGWGTNKQGELFNVLQNVNDSLLT